MDNLAFQQISKTILFVGVKQALGSHDNLGLPCNNPAELLLHLAGLCEDHMGGSSGVVSIPMLFVELEKLGEGLMYIHIMSAHGQTLILLIRP